MGRLPWGASGVTGQVEIGCAYDLCYNAWDADARAKVEDYLDWILFKCLHRQHRVGTVNWAPGSNYTVVIHAGNGLAALALGGEKGPAPVEPLAPRTEAPRIPPAVHSFPAGVPVVKLEPGKTPTEWLWIGPFESRVLQHEHPYFAYQDPVDCLAAMGGMAKARPETGTKVSFRKQTLEWKPLSIKTDPRFFSRTTATRAGPSLTRRAFPTGGRTLACSSTRWSRTRNRAGTRCRHRSTRAAAS